MIIAPPVTPEGLYLQDQRRRTWDETERKNQETLERWYYENPDRDPSRQKTTGVIHMQADSSKYSFGTPIHYVGGGMRRKNQFRTTDNANEVTCKNCIAILNNH